MRLWVVQAPAVLLLVVLAEVPLLAACPLQAVRPS